MEKIVEAKKCKNCGIDFNITDKDILMLNDLSPVIDWGKFSLPNPTFCPDCRLQRKLTFRNDKKLYKRKCDFTGKTIISMYSPECEVKIYDKDIRHSDKRDPLDYWLDIDFDKSFFDQFKQLYHSVPQSSLINEESENSDYCQHCANMKWCYLVHWSANVQDSYYWYRIVDCNNVYDSTRINRSSNIYQSLDIDDSSSLFFSQNCKNCFNSWYLYNCIWCQDCFACVNLVNASYCIENKQYTKEDYHKKIALLKNEYNSGLFKEFYLTFPHKNLDIIWSENVTWDNIQNSQNIDWSFNIHNCENIRYWWDLYNKMELVMDCFAGYWPATKIYESVAAWIGSYNNYFLYYCYPCWDAYYSIWCFNCKHIFLCNWLQNKEYCILNKQYTKEEYKIIIPQIIRAMMVFKEWWEFFPASISLFSYNETIAQEHFPFSKQEAINKWFKRSDYESPIPNVVKVYKKSDIEALIGLDDDILNYTIECEVTWRPFRIIKKELDFYRKYKLCLPTKHPDIRHQERLSQKNPRKLRDKKCDKCWVDIKTTYSPDRSEVIYCEWCYNQEIY